MLRQYLIRKSLATLKSIKLAHNWRGPNARRSVDRLWMDGGSAKWAYIASYMGWVIIHKNRTISGESDDFVSLSPAGFKILEENDGKETAA